MRLAIKTYGLYSSTMSWRTLMNRPLWSGALVLGLAIILIVLAVLQYRWSGQIMEADRKRIEAGLQTAVGQFRREFNRELQDICAAFHLDPSAARDRDWSLYAPRYDDWSYGAAYPDLVANVYVWEAGDEDDSRLLRLNTSSKQFEALPWPSHLEVLRSRIATQPRRPPRMRGLRVRSCVWTTVEQVPILMQPVARFSFRRRGPEFAFPRRAGYVLIELAPTVLRDKFLPELVQQYFGSPSGLVYRVAVFGGRNSDDVVYESDPDSSIQAFSSPDARIRLVWDPREMFAPPLRGGDPVERTQPPGGRAGPGGPLFPDDNFLRRLRGRGPRPVLLLSSGFGDWELAVKHRRGSLDAAVGAVRRRNLAVSFGILLLLAVSVTMIVASSQRAQRLAKLQMDFVAGVSHELRTPLAVMRSAADNLADGVVESLEQAKQYGEVMRREGRRLTGMVEQTLAFAAGQAPRREFKIRRVEVAQVVAEALEQNRPMIESLGFTVEKHVDADLPAVRADKDALTQCLANLIANALKYSGGARWMAVRSQEIVAAKRREVQLTVEDRGPGIDKSEASQVFEPFFRGRLATAAQIEGAGLGLSLAQEAMAAMGGRITIKSTPGQGSAFTLHLPASESAGAKATSGT